MSARKDFYSRRFQTRCTKCHVLSHFHSDTESLNVRSRETKDFHSCTECGCNNQNVFHELAYFNGLQRLHADFMVIRRRDEACRKSNPATLLMKSRKLVSSMFSQRLNVCWKNISSLAEPFILELQKRA